MKTLEEIQAHHVEICKAISQNACTDLDDTQVSQVAGEFIKLAAFETKIINETYTAGQSQAIERIKKLGKNYGGIKQ